MDLAGAVQGTRVANCFQLSPDGRYALTLRVDSHNPFVGGSTKLAIELASGTVRELAGGGILAGWLDAGHPVFQNSQSYEVGSLE